MKYEEYNVAEDREAARKMMEKSKAMAVPVTVIDDKEVIIGFDRVKLDKALA